MDKEVYCPSGPGITLAAARAQSNLGQDTGFSRHYRPEVGISDMTCWKEGVNKNET